MSFCGYLLTALIIIRQHFTAAGQPSVLEAPTLTQVAVRVSSVELVCQAPQGYGGFIFKLFKVQQLIDTVQHSTKQQEARFVLRENNTDNTNLYCCQYENSMYSSYMKPDPKFSISTPPPPHLVVEPSSSHAMLGKTLSFHCQASPTPQELPEAFLLLQRARGTPGSMVAPFKLVSQSQQSRFSVRITGHEDGGEYMCLYQITLPNTGQVNSTASQPVYINVIELPVPTLSISHQGGEVLECVGSPSYPQAFFSLFIVGTPSHYATHQASPTQHSARFPILTQYEHNTMFQCQYSVQLGNSWAYSKMSIPVTLPCITGHHLCTPSSADNTGNTDLALIVGSLSAGVLVLMVVSLLGFAIHKHVKATAVSRWQREQEKLWNRVHSRDHIVDLTLKRIDIGSEDFGRAFRGRPSVSEPIYDCPMTTFNNPTV
ncbi:uncharacterized protein LOC127646362 [Xyrauchen texanus]|uniref:uncharacterized protein LOC127646362 n=1 Tax=Xyrauchen texanus TaxID=154827 RepID=UPI002241CCFF|nr:uncharacterized protein LOC127646362 [Xyrauchen texanus]